MKLIVGLGNPGPRYAKSRHNVGFRCVDAISRHAGITMSERRQLAVIGQGRMEGEEVVLVKPRTFMNHSGDAVSYLIDRFHTPLHDLLIIYDDMDLPIGKIRIRPEGSAGGQRGMVSIISALRSQEFPRIRVGIGRPPEETGGVSHVLGSFSREEERMLLGVIDTVRDAVIEIVVHGVEIAMNKYN